MISASPQQTGSPPVRILNDSSFAAVTLQNNDRYLFFQDQTGVVKQAVYSNATNSWGAAFSNSVAFDARNHTPFAVLSVPGAEDLTGLYGIYNKSESVIPLHSEKAKSN